MTTSRVCSSSSLAASLAFPLHPWYRADPGGAKLALLADPDTADWHEFGMEWQEHIAWIAPLLATAVAFAVTYYGVSLIKHQTVRKGSWCSSPSRS
jgi:hypothetical protein